jgi:Na+/proline symporter
MTTLTIIAISVSAFLYLGIAVKAYLRAGRLADFLPLLNSGDASVRSDKEFGASTVATTISLSSVIMAFAELANYFGLWLLWAVATTVCGLLLVRVFCRMIWRRLETFGDERPTLHQFLGKSFGSSTLPRAAALATSVGFLGALAVELTVGARFLVGLAPDIPQTLGVLVLAAIGVSYTFLGGFRVVVVTDRIQMIAIWFSILALGSVLAWQVHLYGGLLRFFSSIDPPMWNFSWRDGLAPFLIGIAAINVPAYLADMSMWQRIAGVRDESVVAQGLWGSALGALFSWTAFVLITCCVVFFAAKTEGLNPLTVWLLNLSGSKSFVLTIALFLIIVGFYAASLSAASTQLIAAGHAIHTDLLRFHSNKRDMANSASEMTLSRFLLLGIAGLAIAVVETLRALGFSIADLVFAVYGAQLGMVPVVMLALFGSEKANKSIGGFAAVAVIAGFVMGWGSAIYGKLGGGDDLVFLAPAISLGTSASICCVGLLTLRVRRCCSF